MKAVVFTHFENRLPADNWQYTASMERGIIEDVVPYYKAYLRCENVGLVYVYIDTGLRLILNNLFKGGDTLNISVNELAFEHTTRNILKLAVDQAIRELCANDPSFNTNTMPKFQFIGLPHMASLIGSLYRIDPDLVRNLAAHNFTYDAPKFVEAVIRLARGKHALLSQDPVFRFDADVEINEKSIAILLSKVKNALIQQYEYSFFSGGYGDLGSTGDPINDHAVRCHWLAQNITSPHLLIPKGMQFLQDIGEFGATQISNSLSIPPSKAMENYLDSMGQDRINRDSEQVISGAGLYMSLSAIQLLPPFMNFENNIIWVDDHLKRRLHEVLGDIAPHDLEHVDGALFKQNRYPSGIKPDDIEWTKKTYFYRLVSGCIMHDLITDKTGKPGRLAQFINTFLNNFKPIRDSEIIELTKEFSEIAQKTATNILEIWIKANYGNTVLNDWATENQQELTQKKGKLFEWINLTVQDAIRYCQLVQNWNAYVFAIQKLGPRDAYWLFRSTEL